MSTMSCAAAARPECGLDEAVGLGRAARLARLAVGVAFLAGAGASGSRRVGPGIGLWPAAVVATWFGISHLVAAAIGYRGCPELGAIPSVLAGRTLPTRCGPWEHADRRLERS